MMTQESIVLVFDPQTATVWLLLAFLAVMLIASTVAMWMALANYWAESRPRRERGLQARAEASRQARLSGES